MTAVFPRVKRRTALSATREEKRPGKMEVTGGGSHLNPPITIVRRLL